MNFIVKAWLRSLLALLLSMQTVLVLAQAVQAVPPLSGRVVDMVGVLSHAEQAELDTQLARIEQQRGLQVVILLVASTLPEDIASYANRVANTWKIGRREVGDGVLVVVARHSGKLRIEVAKSLEGAIPDLAAKQIIDEVMVPLMRQGNFAGGLREGVARIDARMGSEKLPTPQPSPASTSRGFAQLGFEGMDFIIFLLFAVPMGAAVAKDVFGNKLGSLITGGAAAGLAWIVTTSFIVAGLACALAGIFALATSSRRAISARRTSPSPNGWQTNHSGGWGDYTGSGLGAGGGFSSGGGGDFGGGGASGDFGGGDGGSDGH